MVMSKMLRIVGYSMSEGTLNAIIGEFESVQMTCEDLRDPDGNIILHYYAPDKTWFDSTGNGWYDWTVENA